MVARARGLIASAAVTAVALAGCSGGPGVPAGIPHGDGGEALPTLHGVVVDEAIRPLPGALVRFLGEDGVGAVTDQDGAYAIHRPTGRAHAVLVSASKPGYLARTQQVQVSGQLSAKLGFMLEADPTLVPRLDILENEGLVRCSAAVAAGGEQWGADCPGDRRDEDDKLPAWMWDINPTPGLAGAVVEVYWEPQTAAASRLHAWLKVPMAGGQGGEVVAEATGTAPLRLEVPQHVAEAMPRWTAIRLHVELAEGDGGTPGAALEQPYTAFASLFYVDPAPPGYRLP